MIKRHRHGSPKKKGRKPISFFDLVSTGNTYRISEYIESHAPNLSECNTINQTALHIALFKRYLRTAEVLLKAGAPVDKKLNRETLLHWAIGIKYFGAIKLLLRYGADVYLENAKGQSCISLANDLGDRDVIKLLKKSSSILRYQATFFDGRSHKVAASPKVESKSEKISDIDETDSSTIEATVAMKPNKTNEEIDTKLVDELPTLPDLEEDSPPNIIQEEKSIESSLEATSLKAWITSSNSSTSPWGSLLYGYPLYTASEEEATDPYQLTAQEELEWETRASIKSVLT